MQNIRAWALRAAGLWLAQMVFCFHLSTGLWYEWIEALLPAMWSDAAHSFLYALVSLAIAMVLAGIWWAIEQRTAAREALLGYLIWAAARYYLALALITYGWSKCFKWQFFQPEPNTLYTPLGQLTPDLLFWSSVGVSHGYTVFGGAMEVLAALLLFSRRWAIWGAALSLGVMLNVFAINIFYNISVKLLSGFLVGLSLAVMLPEMGRIWRGWVRGEAVEARTWPPKRRWAWLFWAKAAFCIFMVGSSLSPYLETGIYNDDLAPRPPLHGAYRVDSFALNGQPIAEGDVRWRRWFVHRRGYFVVQYPSDAMRDFRLETDTAEQVFWLTDRDSSLYMLHYQEVGDSAVWLYGYVDSDTIEARCLRLDWRGLPALQPEFTLFSD